MEHLTRSPLFAVVMVAFVLGEAFWRVRLTKRGYNVKAAFASLAVGIGNVLSGVLYATTLGASFVAASHLAPVHWSIRDWRVWLVGWVLVEFLYYWQHRLNHSVRWMWATHAVHHSPEEMTFLSAFRLGWTNLFSGSWLLYLTLALVGFDPRMVLGLLAFDLHYQFFLHTEAFGSWGPLEWVLNTPTHHRVHHASNSVYLDCNFGGMLIVFDRLFGTFVSERSGEPIRYGLAHPLGSNNPFIIAFGEWKRLAVDMRNASGVRGAVGVALGRP
jgi:sterol desaturase/sphingolipid hydroxylase (fatty acid hydroxylase superfamily)